MSSHPSSRPAGFAMSPLVDSGLNLRVSDELATVMAISHEVETRQFPKNTLATPKKYLKSL